MIYRGALLALLCFVSEFSGISAATAFSNSASSLMRAANIPSSTRRNYLPEDKLSTIELVEASSVYKNRPKQIDRTISPGESLDNALSTVLWKYAKNGIKALVQDSIDDIAGTIYNLSSIINVIVKQSFMTSDDIKNKLSVLRPLLTQSFLASRLLNWPRGYPGDFETIEAIVRVSKEMVGPSKLSQFGSIFETMIHTSPLCQQHRNKVDRQAAMMIQNIQRPFNEGGSLTDAPAEVLSLACGPCLDVRQIQSGLLDSTLQDNFHVTLLDYDPEALAFSKSKLNDRMKAKSSFVLGNVMKLHRGNVLKADKKYDLVVMGGLFDYLSEKIIVRLLSYMCGDHC